MRNATKQFKINYLLFFLVGMLCTLSALAQAIKPIESGKIVFERKQNIYKILNVLYSNTDITYYKNYVEDYKSKNPQFESTQFSLTFHNQKSVYQPLPNQVIAERFVASCASYNIVLNDLVNQISQSQKNILTTDFILSDTLRKIKWRITNETREIAGFTCRRANALILDSVYVVAFYTDEIVTKSGPESFSGLPGMILGLALPNEQVTWFAKNYSTITETEFKNQPVVKGKKISKNQLLTLLKNNDQLTYEPKRMSFIIKRVMF